MNIRDARPDDAPELAGLTTELGYPSTADDVAQRLPFLLGRDDQRVLVAVDDDDRAIGWIHMTLQRSIEDEPFAKIAGLVVAPAARGGGVGSRLVAEGERWAREQRVHVVRVRTNVMRERTHGFYRKIGYVLKK